MNRLWRRVVCILLLAAGSIATPQLGLAQKLRWFQLDGTKAVYEVLLGAQFRSFGIGTTVGVPPDQISLLLGERLGGAASGSILHPRFLVFNGGLSLLALQQDRSGYVNETNAFTNTLRLEYKGTATMRKESTAPLFLTAERSTDIVRRDFVPNYDLLRTAHTANWVWQNAVAPLNLGVAKTSLTYGVGDPGYGADDLVQASANARRKMVNSDAGLEYRMQDYTNIAKPWLTYLSHDAMASYVWRGDPCRPRRYEADANIRFNRRTAAGERDQWLANLTAIQWWTEALSSRGGYRLLYQASPEATVTQHTGWADVRQRLYRSLTLGATLQGGVRSLVDGSRLFGSAATDVNYTKRLGSFGTMTHLWQQTYYTERGENLGGLREVLAEPHILNSQEAVVLDHERVLRSTVRVIDAGSLKLYVEKIDYELYESGLRTTIRRVLGSTIEEGTALRIDYTYEEPSGRGVTSYDNRWTGRYTLPMGSTVLAYAEAAERWANRWTVGQSLRQDRFETLTLGSTGHWKNLDATIEGRRWQAMELHITDLSAMLATTQLVGSLRSSIGGRALVQWLQADTWYNYEAFVDSTLPVGDKVALGGRFRYLARTGYEGLAQTVDGDAYAWWQWRQLRIRADYRVQATWREEAGTQSHRIFISLGRPL